MMNIAHKIRTPYAVSSIALSPDKRQVAVANGLLTEILIYDVATGEQVIQLETDAPSSYENTLLWKGGYLLAAAKSGTQLYVWDAGTFELKYRYEVGPSSIKSMDVDVDGRKIVLVLEKPIKAVMNKLGLQDVSNVLQLDLDTGELITEKSIGRELMAGGYTGKNSSLSLLNNSKNEIGEWSLDEIEVHCIKDGNADRLNASESRRITTHAADEAAWAYNPESNSQIVILSLPEGRQAFFGALGEEPKSLSCVGEPIGAVAKDAGFVILTQEEGAYFLESVQREDAITILLPGEASNAIASQNGLLAVGVDNSAIMYS